MLYQERGALLKVRTDAGEAEARVWLGERGGGSSSRGICVASTSGVRRTKKRFDVIRDGCETRLRCWRQFQNLFTIMPQFRVMHPSLHHSCYRFRRSVALMYKSFFLKKCEPKQKRNGEGQTSPTQCSRVVRKNQTEGWLFWNEKQNCENKVTNTK